MQFKLDSGKRVKIKAKLIETNSYCVSKDDDLQIKIKASTFVSKDDGHVKN